METHYLIDYENVGSSGLEGCGKLGKTDHIHIFFTNNNKKIDMDIVHDHGGAEFKTYKVPGGKQSLDKHLVSFLGYLTGFLRDRVCNYVIVSKDKDYEDIIAFWEKEVKSHNINAKFSLRSKLSEESVENAENEEKSPVEKTAKKTAKKTGSIKQKLNTEVMQKLSEEDYSKEMIGEVAHIVNIRFGEDGFLSVVHNDLRDNYDNYLAVYNIIKPVLQKYAGVTGENSDNIADRTKLNNEIQQILSKAGKDGKVITEVASVVAKNAGVKNGKQLIYRTIISKFGQKEGLDLYNRIKKSI